MLMLNLNQLRVFYEVAKTQSFSLAAQNLHVSQPAVSKSVKLFQESCRLALFRRRKGRLYLTDEGEKILLYASKIFDVERELLDKIENLQNLKEGSLRIGTTKTYARYFMPAILSSFQSHYPDLVIELDEGSSRSMLESLIEFRNSLAITAKVIDRDELSYIPLLREEVLFIVAPDHHMALRDSIDFKELQNEPIIMKEKGSGTRKLIETCARNEKIELNVIAQTSNMGFIKQLVKQKLAVSFVVRSSVEDELSCGELVAVPVRPFDFSLDICIAHLRGPELPFAAQAFLDYIIPLANSTGLSSAVKGLGNQVPPGPGHGIYTHGVDAL